MTPYLNLSTEHRKVVDAAKELLGMGMPPSHPIEVEVDISISKDNTDRLTSYKVIFMLNDKSYVFKRFKT